jgi:hypothetical protein
MLQVLNGALELAGVRPHERAAALPWAAEAQFFQG